MKKTCMNCHDEITPENDGIEINGGEFYQCEDCHKIEHGTRIYACLLYYANKPPDPMDKWIKELNEKFEQRYGRSLENKGMELLEYGRHDIFYTDWDAPVGRIKLDGEFSIEQLQALIDHMKRYQK